MAGKPKGGMSQGKLLLAAGTIIAIIVVAVGLMMASTVKPVYREVEMTGAEFAKEYSGYHTNVSSSTTFPNDYYYNFPSLKGGDTLKIGDRITKLTYSNSSDSTYVVLSGFEGNPALSAGLYFASNLTGKYSAGDTVQMTFHVVFVEKKNAEGKVLYSGEVLDELNGPAREKSSTPNGITPSAIKKM